MSKADAKQDLGGGIEGLEHARAAPAGFQHRVQGVPARQFHLPAALGAADERGFQCAGGGQQAGFLGLHEGLLCASMKLVLYLQ